MSDILSALQAEPGKRIADIGAGEGFYSLRIARAVGPTGRVTAVDVSEKYLEKLRARIQQDNVTNVDVVVGAVDDPRLAQDTFDSVLIYNAYHEMTTPEPILKAIFMALKPGGRLVMSEPLHDNVRSATRAEQVKDHEIGPNFVQQELQAAGFEVIEQRPDFLAFTRPRPQGRVLADDREKTRIGVESELSREATMACSCCACGNTADQHFNAEKVAKELRQYRRKGPGPTTRGLRDGLVSIGLRQGTSPRYRRRVLASSVSSCSTPDSVAPSWWRPRLRTLRLLQKRLFVVDGRHQQSWSMAILWLSRVSWHQPPPLPLIALCAAIRSTNRCSSRPCGSRNSLSRCRIPEIVGS